MNILTNLLYLLYFYYFTNIDTLIYFLTLGVFLPYSQEFILPLAKNKLKYYNKFSYSIFVLSTIDILLSFIFNRVYNYGFIHILLILLLGNILTISTAITKNKNLYIFYPFVKKGYSLSLSNYFDPIPITIMMSSIFVFIFRSGSLSIIEKFIPLIIILIYFMLKFIIKKYICKKLNLDKKNIIIPSFNFFIWRIIIAKNSGNMIYNYNLLLKNIDFASYYDNTISEDNNLLLEESKLYLEFKRYFKKTYKKEYIKDNKTYLFIFDLKNFFSFFKREQIFLEIIIKDNKIYKEKIYI